MSNSIGMPSVAEKLGAVCEKLRLVYWLYNNDGNGCGPIQGIPIAYFGDWTMDEFHCDGRNILQNPVPISYNNWNDNFNQWTGVLNPISSSQWDWINAGKPCFRVMSTLTCDDTVYGDFLLTPVSTVNPKIDGKQYLIQPEVLIGPEVEVLICRRIDKSGVVTKEFYDKSGDPIASLTDYYAEKAESIAVAATGTRPFTSANISKFYTEDELCDCLKSCDHEYPAIDDSAPCQIQFHEGGCIYVRDDEGNVNEVVTGASQNILFGVDGSIKGRTVVQGSFQEDFSDNVVLFSSAEPDSSTLPDGWYYDPSCTGALPEGPEPPECPPGTQLFPGTKQEHGVIADNSNWTDAPAVNIPNGPIYTLEGELADGTIATASGTSWFPIRDVLNLLGYKTNVANANHPNGSADYGLPSWVPAPDSAELFALGWFGCKCGSELIRLEIIEHTDPAWIGVTRDLTIHQGPKEKIFWANICGIIYAKDCSGKDIIVDPCCISSPEVADDTLNQFKFLKGITDADYDSAFQLTFGRPLNTASWLLENANGVIASSDTFDGFKAALGVAGYTCFIAGPTIEAHYICPCPSNATLTINGEITDFGCLPFEQIENSDSIEKPARQCVLRTQGCLDQDILDAIKENTACLKRLFGECEPAAETCDYTAEFKSSGITSVLTDKGEAVSSPHDFPAPLAPPQSSANEATMTAAASDIQTFLDANGGGTVSLEYVSQTIMQVKIVGTTCVLQTASDDSNPGPHDFIKAGSERLSGFNATPESVEVLGDKTVELAAATPLQVSVRKELVGTTAVKESTFDQKANLTKVVYTEAIQSKATDVTISRVAEATKK